MLCIYIYRNAILTIIVLPSQGSEPEETFTITLISASGGVVIDQGGNMATVTVSLIIIMYATFELVVEGFFTRYLRKECRTV